MSTNTITIEAEYINSLWRNEKTGTGIYRCRTCNPAVMNYHQGFEVIGETTWYFILIDCSTLPLPLFLPHAPLIISGRFMENSRGFMLLTNSCTESYTDLNYLRNYLLSVSFPEINRLNIDNIINEFGYTLYEAAEADLKTFSERLGKCSGLSSADALSVAGRLIKARAEQSVMQLFSEYDISYPKAVAAVRKFGFKAKRAFTSNPFKYGKQIGLKFQACDKIAASLRYTPYNVYRIQAAADELMEQLESSGSTLIPAKKFYDGLMKKLYNPVYVGFNPQLANIMSLLGKNYGTETLNSVTYVFRTFISNAEKRIATNLIRLSSDSRYEPFDPSLLSYSENMCNIQYGMQQRLAFNGILATRGIKIIDGGPGTGKTTLVKGIIAAYKKMHPNHVIKLCAPTGRAAQRLSEGADMPATTIHRLVDYKPYGESFTYKNKDNPIEADMIVIDETSMCDVIIFDILLDAIKTGTTVILAGDINQLESVGPGAILRDLLKTDNLLIRKYYLTEIFRQKNGSVIIDNAKKIREGDYKLTESDDFVVYNTKSDEETVKVVQDLFNSLYNPSTPFSTQVLCPTKKGLGGIDYLNSLFHTMYKDDAGIEYGNTKFIPGDKIIMNSNNPTLDYYNGDLGTVIKAERGKLEVDIRGSKITLEHELLDDVELAYSCTIHKSQGSEFDTVIIVLQESPSSMHYRNLFYTAVTRAKKRVFVVNECYSMEASIRKTKTNDRITGLCNYLPIA